MCSTNQPPDKSCIRWSQVNRAKISPEARSHWGISRLVSEGHLFHITLAFFTKTVDYFCYTKVTHKNELGF